MALSNSAVAARLTETYKGIEGFYILNAAGGLGYFSSDGRRLIGEAFTDPDGDAILPADKVDLFFSELCSAAVSFPPGNDKELGYVVPVSRDTVWKTATLVLHEQVAKDLKDAFDRDLTQGSMSLDEGDRRINDMTVERGLHRGIEDLVNHIGTFGINTFFPVLYYLSASDRESLDHDQPMRVLNLMWLVQGAGRFTEILSLMRWNLVERGALNKASRVEHKFTLQE